MPSLDSVIVQLSTINLEGPGQLTVGPLAYGSAQAKVVRGHTVAANRAIRRVVPAKAHVAPVREEAVYLSRKIQQRKPEGSLHHSPPPLSSPTYTKRVHFRRTKLTCPLSVDHYVTTTRPKCYAKVREEDILETLYESLIKVVARKLVIIGDGACGKTSLLSVFTLGYFPTVGVSPSPPLSCNCRVDGKSVQLALWDTAGQEDYERLRPLAYAKAHVILIGFSIDTPDSLDNVKHKWVEEANERCPGVPIILVGLKKDLREDPLAQEEMRKKSLHFTTDSEGSNAGREIGARKYLECSSLTGEGVDDVFEAATRAALLTFEKGERGGCCTIL
ncbi:MAG: hypothetical protein Q9218_006298 [Villophora microphyllina]